MITPITARSTVIPTSFIDAFTPFSSLYPSIENNCTKVDPPITIFAFCSPMNAINRPIPTLTADFKFSGIALKIASRTFVTDNTMNTRPSTKTAASAICQLYPIPITTVYAKYAFSPIPGASANG